LTVSQAHLGENFLEPRDLEELLEKKIGYVFKNSRLLREALTHRSFANEQPGEDLPHNERLEFLGDAVLDLAISQIVFNDYEGFTEGDLTRVRAEVVNEKTLAGLGRQWALGSSLLLGRGEERSGGRDKDSLLADTLEALLGAVFCDGGFERAYPVIEVLFRDEIRRAAQRKISVDHKTRLQELCQARYGALPAYRIIDVQGPDHLKIYTVEVQFEGRILASATGRTKKGAEQDAARQALVDLELSRMRIYPIFIPHAGCSHHCVFCNQHSLCDQDILPSPDDIAAFLDDVLPPRGDGEVAFFGGSFTLIDNGLRRTFLETARSFVGQGRVSGIRISTRPDALCAAVIAGLRDGGVTTVEIGCQSFSDQVLERAGRGHGSRDAIEAVGRLRTFGLNVGLQLMPGLPGGDRDEALSSLETALSLDPDFIRIYPTVVISGTPLETAYRSGSYRPLGLEEAVDLCADMFWRSARAGVEVIRLGLQATPELDKGNILVAGPYHPAFGQLVRSRLWLRALEANIFDGGDPLVAVHPADFSDARGHGNGNLKRLKAISNDFDIRSCREIPRQQFRVNGRLMALMDTATHKRTVQT